MASEESSPAKKKNARAAKPMRADAQRNRARILETAEAVLAVKGTSASTEDIAQQAGVGVGTLFRHFPTKEALLEAVFVGRLRRLAEEADALSAANDPGVAFFAFFARVVDQAATKSAFADALAQAGIDVENAAEQTGYDLRQALHVLLIRAQQAGAVRNDVGVPELIALLVGISRAMEHAGWDRDVQARTLAIVFDGLRPAASRSPPLAP